MKSAGVNAPAPRQGEHRTGGAGGRVYTILDSVAPTGVRKRHVVAYALLIHNSINECFIGRTQPREWVPWAAGVINLLDQ